MAQRMTPNSLASNVNSFSQANHNTQKQICIIYLEMLLPIIV